MSTFNLNQELIAEVLGGRLSPNPYYKDDKGELHCEYDEIVVEKDKATFFWRDHLVSTIPTNYDPDKGTISFVGMRGRIPITLYPVK